MDIWKVFEPEESVGKLWHSIAGRLAAEQVDSSAAVRLDEVRHSLAVLFRALGGAHDVEIAEAAEVRVAHQRTWRRRLSRSREFEARPSFDGERLRLPPIMSEFASVELNRAAYLWLTATAAVSRSLNAEWPASDAALHVQESSYLWVNTKVAERVKAACPGLRRPHARMQAEALARRDRSGRGSPEVERRLYLALSGQDGGFNAVPDVAIRKRVPPVPFWLDVYAPPKTAAAASGFESGPSPGGTDAGGTPKQGERRDLDEANRKDSFIVHRFETILSWAESMDINRSVQDDDEEHAKKAAEDQESVTLSRHDRKTATRLHLHLDLSPAEAEHERLAGKYVYPEWNHRRQAYMHDHCRVLDALPDCSDGGDFDIDRKSADRVRRQFEVLRTRRVLEKRQTDGIELDLDALIEARADLAATGRGSDRIYVASRLSQRDLSVALLIDTSRSTEATMDGTSVIDVSRHAVSALAHGLDACGDRFGIWSFSSLKRNRVFLTRCKSFEAPMSADVDRRIAALRPGHYTRLGAAVRHVSAQLAKEPSAQKLLLLLTDGKPNDVDHYEGKHGIEDSRMAVREARRDGLIVHAVVIDEDGQDWFARIFDRSGFTLLPRPDRLMTALPDIYRSLTRDL